MESVTDPKLLENRLFYKLGEFTYDYRKKVLVIGLLACIGMASLIAMGPNWAESWGVGEHESVQASDLREDAFIGEEEDAEGFVFLVYHESLGELCCHRAAYRVGSKCASSLGVESRYGR